MIALAAHSTKQQAHPQPLLRSCKTGVSLIVQGRSHVPGTGDHSGHRPAVARSAWHVSAPQARQLPGCPACATITPSLEHPQANDNRIHHQPSRRRTGVGATAGFAPHHDPLPGLSAPILAAHGRLNLALLGTTGLALLVPQLRTCDHRSRHQRGQPAGVTHLGAHHPGYHAGQGRAKLRTGPLNKIRHKGSPTCGTRSIASSRPSHSLTTTDPR